MKKPVLSAILAVAGLIGAFSSALAAPPPKLPPETFFRDLEAEGLTLSPTGEYMTVEVPKGDRTVLVAMRTDDLKPMKVWDFGENNHISRTVWVTDNRILVYMAKKLGTQDSQVLLPNTLLTDIDGKNQKYVEWGAAYNIVNLTPDDPRTIVVERNMPEAQLFKLNVHTGTFSKYSSAPLQPGSFLVDEEGNPLYALGQKDDSKSYVLKREANGWKEIHSSPMGGAVIRPLRLAPDGKHVYMAISDHGEPERLVLRNMDTNTDQVLVASQLTDIDGTVSTFDRKGLAMVKYDGDIPSYEFVDPSSQEAKVFGGVINSFDDKIVEFLGRTHDGSKFIFVARSDVDPGSFYLFDRATGKARFLMASRPWVKPETMSQMNPITVTARDGKKIHGYLTIPNGSSGKNLPLIMHPHGGPHGPRDSWGYNPQVQFLANRGYAVLQVNFRGSGGYGNAFEKAGYRNWGTSMIDDMTDSIKELIKEGIVDKDRICTFGASYGGYAALQLPIREPDLFKCAVGYVGVYDLDQLRKDSDIGDRNAGLAYLNRVYPTTSEERRAQSPMWNVDKLKATVALVHGGMDERVPISQFYLLKDRLEKAGKAPEFTMVEKKEGHGFRLPENQIKLANQLETFFAKHIGDK